MSLKLKRLKSAVEESVVAELRKQLVAVLGREPQLELDLDGMVTIADDVAALQTIWGKGVFEPISAAVNEIAQDAMGKQALQDGLQTVSIKSECTNNLLVKFTGRRLEIDSRFTHVDYITSAEVEKSRGKIRDCLERGL